MKAGALTKTPSTPPLPPRRLHGLLRISRNRPLRFALTPTPTMAAPMRAAPTPPLPTRRRHGLPSPFRIPLPITTSHSLPLLVLSAIDESVPSITHTPLPRRTASRRIPPATALPCRPLTPNSPHRGPQRLVLVRVCVSRPRAGMPTSRRRHLPRTAFPPSIFPVARAVGALLACAVAARTVGV